MLLLSAFLIPLFYLLVAASKWGLWSLPMWWLCALLQCSKIVIRFWERVFLSHVLKWQPKFGCHFWLWILPWNGDICCAALGIFRLSWLGCFCKPGGRNQPAIPFETTFALNESHDSWTWFLWCFPETWRFDDWARPGFYQLPASSAQCGAILLLWFKFGHPAWYVAGFSLCSSV